MTAPATETTPSHPPIDLAERARQHTFALVSHLSVTSTEGEASFADHLRSLLMAFPYFQARPDHVRIQDVEGSAFPRRNVLALLKGNGRRTVVLSGHYDVVHVADYGPLAPLATLPDPLRDALIERLERTGEDQEALDDLRSGAFVPGRGLLDMKAGIGAGLAVLEAAALDPGLIGNVILLASPDEENQSAGMRAAGALLAEVAAEHDLDLALQINLDALQDEGDPADAQCVGLGCIGKHLVTAFVVGRPAHACYPLTGLSAPYLASAVVAALEYRADLTERWGDEVTAPPVALIQSDLRDTYDVTTPARTWCAWNVIVQRRTAEAVLSSFRSAIATAVADALAVRAARAAGEGVAFTPEDVPVITFEELDAEAARAPTYAAARAVLTHDLATRADLSTPAKARLLTELAWETSGRAGPAVVVGFGSLSYPAVPPLAQRGAGDLEGLVREAARTVAAEHDVAITFRDYLPIISDMSFPGLGDKNDARLAARNNPLWGSILSWDIEGYPSIPIINAGPWGRDYHHPLERAYAPYSFGVLPHLVDAIARAVRQGKTEPGP